MAVSITDLAAELTTDSAGLGYNWPSSSNGLVLEKINAPYITGKLPLTANQRLGWAVAEGRAAKLHDAKEHTDVAIRAIALVAGDILGRADVTLDVLKYASLLDALVAASPPVLLQADVDALVALADTQVSRAQELWGETVKLATIRDARDF